MPRCYLLAIAESSVHDRDTNRLSLFHIIEEAELQQPIPTEAAVGIPGELHCYMEHEPSEVGSHFELRIFVTARDTGEVVLASPVLAPYPAQKRRMRIRTKPVPVPKREGIFDYRVEWRHAGSEGAWNREATFYPLEIKIAAPQPE